MQTPIVVWVVAGQPCWGRTEIYTQYEEGIVIMILLLNNKQQHPIGEQKQVHLVLCSSGHCIANVHMCTCPYQHFSNFLVHVRCSVH